MLEQELAEGKEPTRLAALRCFPRIRLAARQPPQLTWIRRWISVLLMGSRSEVLAHQGDLAPALLDGLADSSDQVVLQALDVQASLAREDPHFRLFMVRLAGASCWRGLKGLSDRRGCCSTFASPHCFWKCEVAS